MLERKLQGIAAGSYRSRGLEKPAGDKKICGGEAEDKQRRVLRGQ